MFDLLVHDEKSPFYELKLIKFPKISHGPFFNTIKEIL